MKHPGLVTAADLANSKPLQPVHRDEVTIFGKPVTLFICSDDIEMAYYVGRQRDSTRVTADINAMPRKIMFDKGPQS